MVEKTARRTKKGCFQKMLSWHWSEQLAIGSFVFVLSLLVAFGITYIYLRETNQINLTWNRLKNEANKQVAENISDTISVDVVRFRVEHSAVNLTDYFIQMSSFNTVIGEAGYESRIIECGECDSNNTFEIQSPSRIDQLDSNQVYLKLVEHLVAGEEPDLTATTSIKRVCDSNNPSEFKNSCHNEMVCTAQSNTSTVEVSCQKGIFGEDYGWGTECTFRCVSEASQITGDYKRRCQRSSVSKKLFWSGEALVCAKTAHCSIKKYFQIDGTKCSSITNTPYDTYDDAVQECQRNDLCKGISDEGCDERNLKLCGAAHSWEDGTALDCVWAKPSIKSTSTCYQVPS